jgi:hypothetical protein
VGQPTYFCCHLKSGTDLLKGETHIVLRERYIPEVF